MARKVTWTDADKNTRTGEVWSPGPTTSTVWVIPDERYDGEGHAVCVNRKGTQSRKEMERSMAWWQANVRDALIDRRDVPGMTLRMEFFGDVYTTTAPECQAPRGGQLTAKMPDLSYYAA